MFTNHQRQVERTGRSGTPRLQYLQELVTEFQKTTDEESKEGIVAHLANFAYDPYNYIFLRQLNVLELFLDCITEPNEKLVEFGVGGICNSCVDRPRKFYHHHTVWWDSFDYRMFVKSCKKHCELRTWSIVLSL